MAAARFFVVRVVVVFRGERAALAREAVVRFVLVVFVDFLGDLAVAMMQRLLTRHAIGRYTKSIRTNRYKRKRRAILVAMADNKSRTYARNRRQFSRRGNENIYESDSAFLLKLILVTLLGALWVRLGTPLEVGGVAITSIPIGFLLGLALVGWFEHFQSNRRIWYVVLILVAIVSNYLPVGIVL